ncbi:TetR/AcrR family transcriptional regulator [Actinoplanes sp. CA-030573]|uniref:TetR/AcrR family transcriptional regulator n=1 Tax=Actinoplanes sp. CA-030573 TaxID=3239898 RepID=UPI003D8ED06A
MPKATYHHGDLRRALLRAAEEAITETGVATLSMRDLSRRAGVSHAAPTHHFGDKAGLLTALATEGFEQLAKALATSRLASNSFVELGVTYIRFAVTKRPLFEVMFRTDLYHAADPALLAARAKAADALYAAVSDLPDGFLAPIQSRAASESAPGGTAPIRSRAALSASAPGGTATFPPHSADAAARPAKPGTAETAPPDVRTAGLAAWSMAHGFATLWLSGAFPDRDLDPAETARHLFSELNRHYAP